MMRNERRLLPPRGRIKKVLWLGATLLLIVAAGVAGWIWRFRTYTPVAVALDIQAAVRARNAPNPARQFLENGYGSLAEPANRQQAFLGFFDLDHMEGLYRITSHMQGTQRQTNIAATAEWIADYRRLMRPEEKAALASHLGSAVGRATLQKATSAYLKRDVAYRAATAPVIAELMTTLAAVQQP